MTHSIKQETPRRRNFIAGIAVATGLGLIWLSPALADEAGAKQAIAQAEGKIDLLSKESPAATQNPSFTLAHDKLTQARAALANDHDRQAEWLANESALLADTTAGAGKLAKLDQDRAAVRHDVDALNAQSNL